MTKDQAKQLVRDTFTHRFQKEQFRRFIKELVNRYDEGKAKSWNSQYIPDAFKDHVERYERLGTFTAAGDGEKVDILIVHLTHDSKLERARTALRNFVAHHLKSRDEKDSGLVAFVSPSEATWRFSFVKMEYVTEEKAGRVSVETHLTPARRFSYLVGEGESCHTAQSRFLSLLHNTSEKPTIDQIAECFSVETVTKEFFNRYYGLFKGLTQSLAVIVGKQKSIREEFRTKHISTDDFAKKLLGQVVFLYFIQKKGWLGVAKGQEWGSGPRNFLRSLAKGEYGNYKNFFNDVLEPLFYDTLATDRGGEAWCSRFKCRIPFLNGGLFEPLCDYNWQAADLTLLNDLFFNHEANSEGDVGTGILDVFDRFNFTVNEAEPLEQEVAIDPEMLGKVFENLLEAEFRKSLGTFYTPREIVHYMCQESLISYLYSAVNTIGAPLVPAKAVQGGLFGQQKPVQSVLTATIVEEKIPRDDLAALVHLGDQAAHYETALKAGTTSYDKKPRPRLPKSIEMHVAEIDDALCDIAVCDPAIGSGAFPVGMMTEIVRARLALNPYFTEPSERTAYHFKRHAIQRSLYGVDIDRGAVEIAKLRLWLSLVVDEEDLKTVKPLPNLDFKVVVGNSLLGFPFHSHGLAEIEKLKASYFDEPDHDRKATIKKEIDQRIDSRLAESEKALGYRVDFDYHLFFSEVYRKGGFDVFIGNPPYIRIQNLDPVLAKEMKRRYASATGKFDIYVLFVEACLAQVNSGGTLCLIHPHRFLTADYGRGIKAFLDKTGGLRSAVLFGVAQVFETATTYTGIFVYSHANQRFEFKYVETRDFQDVLFDKRDYKADGSHWILAPESAGSTDLVVKLKTQALPISSFVSGIYQGIVTVGDDIFVLEKGSKKGKLYRGFSVAAEGIVEVEADLVKPLVKGEHIRRYGVLHSDLGILYPHHLDQRGRTVSYSEAEMKSLFPLGYSYFKPFKKALVEKKIKYKTNPEFWFSLHRSRDQKLFDGRKLITPQLQNMPHFTLDEHGWYPDAGGYSLVGCSSVDEEYFLLGVLNSKVLWYYIKNTSNPYNNSYYYFKTKYLESFTVPCVSSEDQRRIANLARRAISLRQVGAAEADIRKVETQIDHQVYACYKLTEGEIDTVEKAASW